MQQVQAVGYNEEDSSGSGHDAYLERMKAEGDNYDSEDGIPASVLCVCVCVCACMCLCVCVCVQCTYTCTWNFSTLATAVDKQLQAVLLHVSSYTTTTTVNLTTAAVVYNTVVDKFTVGI